MMNVIVETETPAGKDQFRRWVVSVDRPEDLPEKVPGEIRWIKFWDSKGNEHVLGRKGSRASAATEAR